MVTIQKAAVLWNPSLVTVMIAVCQSVDDIECKTNIELALAILMLTNLTGIFQTGTCFVTCVVLQCIQDGMCRCTSTCMCVFFSHWQFLYSVHKCLLLRGYRTLLFLMNVKGHLKPPGFKIWKFCLQVLYSNTWNGWKGVTFYCRKQRK